MQSKIEYGLTFKFSRLQALTCTVAIQTKSVDKVWELLFNFKVHIKKVIEILTFDPDRTSLIRDRLHADSSPRFVSLHRIELINISFRHGRSAA